MQYYSRCKRKYRIRTDKVLQKKPSKVKSPYIAKVESTTYLVVPDPK